ncbi:torsin-1A-interacting protein 2-like isoform X2 [Xiphophorus maculatus]|uniref:torsin-1A-interacting protein 2-like isoform X2 n=1 Tax=Xiphophorus maculatus TaxID=8083 RepID=UPI000C6D1AF8|nr:torsin-1A-interacting protein 2-like isoform X2 [Xiphophorus maculatus]
MDSPPGYQQPKGSADPSAELPDKDDNLQNGDKNSGQQTNDESRDNSSNREKSTDEPPSRSVTTDNSTGTPPEKETTESSTDNVASDEGGADSDEGKSSPAVDKNSGQQTNDESQDNSSNREKSTDEPPSRSVTTDNITGTPPEKETTESSTDDVASGEGDKDGDKNSGQQGNDESRDNLSNREKSTDEPPSRSVTTVKSEEAERDKTNDYQADDKQQGYSKGDPSENKKTVDTTPDKCANQRGMKLLVGVAIVALVAIVAQYYLQSESQPQKTDWQQVDVFLKQMKKVKERFPNQRAELWSRSEIHLKRHLQTSQPAEPVSLILTSGVRAERTMRCLAQGVASAFSTARNASILHIDGAGKAGQDSDQVKLDIDRKLQGAFEGDKPVAVIHRLEELPPGSTLIFYRYCDHENAAYKKTFLIFTVLLGDEEEIPAEMRLSIVEEMVDDYLQKKFLSHGHPVSFDRMDVNKYGGLWSRISHLILPVAAEDRIEHEGC